MQPLNQLHIKRPFENMQFQAFSIFTELRNFVVTSFVLLHLHLC